MPFPQSCHLYGSQKRLARKKLEVAKNIARDASQKRFIYLDFHFRNLAKKKLKDGLKESNSLFKKYNFWRALTGEFKRKRNK